MYRILFSNYPSFFVFDIAASFRDKIKPLNDTPRQITVHVLSFESIMQVTLHIQVDICFKIDYHQRIKP